MADIQNKQILLLRTGVTSIRMFHFRKQRKTEPTPCMAGPQDLLLTCVSPYFLGPTWPTLTRTQMTFLVCMPTEQEASPFHVVVVLKDDTEVSSMHWPHGPVCQWYTVQACSLQLRTSCKALVFGQWAPPVTMDNISRWDTVPRETLSFSVSWN